MLAVGADVGHPSTAAAAQTLAPDGRAVQDELPAREGADADEGFGELLLPVAGDRGDADDLTGADLEAHTVQTHEATVVPRPHVLDDQTHLPRVAPGVRGFRDRGVADDQRRQRRAVQFGPGHPGDGSPGPQNRDVLGDGEHLVELVADEDDRPTGVAERGQQPQQFGRLRGSEHRRGLVEDQHVGPAVHQPQDLHLLLDGDGDTGCHGIPVDLDAHGRGELDGPGTGGAPGQDPGARALVTEDEVLQQGQLGMMASSCCTRPIPRSIAARGEASETG